MELDRQVPHSTAMAAALERAPARDGWIHLPDLPVTYRGPTHLGTPPFGTEGRDRPMLQSLGMVARRTPDGIAYADVSRGLTFAKVQAAVAKLAAALQAMEGDGPVGLLMPGGVTAPIGMLACLAAGRPSVLLDASHAPARNAALLQRAGAASVLGPVAAEEAARLAGLKMLALETAFSGEMRPASASGPVLGLDDVAFILCTSGSTGEPKMVAYSQRGILQQLRIVLDGMCAGEDDRCLLLIPPATIAGLITLLMPLHGTAVDLLPLTELGIAELRQRLRTHPPSILRAGPSLLRTIAALPDAPAMMASLRALRVSGEPLLRADLELLSRCLPPACLVYNRYGSTELIGTSWVARLDDDHDPMRTAAGLPEAEVEVKIVDAAGNACPPGEQGELWMRGRYAALGEWSAEGLAPGRLEHDRDDPALRVYRTGDVARLTLDGVLVVLGRLDRMVKVNGHRVELAEVETALRRNAEVNQAAVVAREVAGRVTLRAFIVASADALPGLELRLRQSLRASLPAYMQPARIELLDALPLLPGGKLDERALLARD